MAAIQRTRLSSSVAGMFVVAIAAALLAGATGGYLVRALSSQVSAPATVVAHPPLKAADQLPSWVQKYNAPAEAPQFKVDEYIRSLGQAQPMSGTSADEPRSQWLRDHATGTSKVDALLRSVNYKGGATIANVAERPTGR